jgi:hypothetical protein
MDTLQILALFFGLPLAIFGLGLRRAIGTGRMLSLVLASSAVGAYALLVEWALRRAGVGLPVPAHPGWGWGRVLFPFCAGAAFLGALGVVLVRFRARQAR